MRYLAALAFALLAIAAGNISSRIIVWAESPLDAIAGAFGLAFGVALLIVALEIIGRKP